jgi:serine/alanine adding enzyme
LNISRINTFDPRYKSFEKFFETHPDSHFFQSGKLYTFIDGLKNYEPLLLVCEDESGTIRGSLLAVLQAENHKILRYFSSGAIIRGGPLVDNSFPGKSDVLTGLLQTLIKITKGKALVIQFRNFTAQHPYLQIFHSFNFVFHDHLNLIISTQDKSSAWSGISNNRQRQINKSIKNGAVIIEQPSYEEFCEFYALLKSIYKRKIHKPLPPWSFFERFYLNSKTTLFGIINLIRFEGKIVGGILCPISDKKMVHEWYVCGLDEQCSAKGIYPSVLATWSAIDYAIKNNIPAFDFMGMGNPKIPYGVRDFKLRFGGTLVNYGRFERINNFPMYWIASKGYHLLKFVYSMLSKMA